MKEELLESIREYFKKNPNLNKVYVTTDDNIFGASHYASNWAVGLPNDKKAIAEVTRAEALGITETAPVTDTDNGGGDKGGAGGNGNNGADAEKEALVKRYVELFDTKPSHFMKVETIKNKIAEKEAADKLAETGGDNQNNSEGNQQQ